MRRLALLFVVACLLSSCSSGTGLALMAPGGECTDCDLSHLEPLVSVPKHGVLFHGGDRYIEADWDKNIVAEYFLGRTDPNTVEGEMVRVAEKEVHISIGEKWRLQALADEIWRHPVPVDDPNFDLSRVAVTGSMLCGHGGASLFLIDGTVTRREEGCPFKGDDANLQKAIEKTINFETVWKALSPSE